MLNKPSRGVKYSALSLVFLSETEEWYETLPIATWCSHPHHSNIATRTSSLNAPPWWLCWWCFPAPRVFPAKQYSSRSDFKLQNNCSRFYLITYTVLHAIVWRQKHALIHLLGLIRIFW